MNKFTKTITGVVSAIALVAVLATSASAATFTRSLTVGSRGADVTTLQTWLNSKGYLAVAPTGYFGALTKAAVAAFQTANGVTPAAGYFGPLTQAKWEAVVAMTPATPGTPSTPSTSTKLAGTDGSIDSVSKLSQYNNEEVGEGEKAVKVAGFEVEASNDGDIALRSLKLTFDGSTNTGSTRLNKFVNSVSVWQGSTKLATVSVDDFTKDSSNSAKWSKTVTLTDSVVKADKKEKFYVSVDGANTYDSSDIGSNDAWSVEVTNIRFEDGSGVVTTDTQSAATTDTAIDFVSFSTSANTELKFSTDSATPDAGPVIVDDTVNTKDVVLTKGKIKVEGTSDVLVDSIPVTFTVTGATDVDAVTGSVTLTIDGNDYSESVSTSAATATITFDNLDLTLTAGKTYSFSIKADINDTNGTSSDFEDGDTLKASITATNRNYVDAENSQGDQLSDSSEKSGTVTGEAQEFRNSGIMLTLLSVTKPTADSAVANNDTGDFVIKFKVTANGDTVYVSSLTDAQLTGVTTGKTTVHVDRAGTATVGGVTTRITNVDTSEPTVTSAGTWTIEDGSSATFELTTTVSLPSAGLSGNYQVQLGGISYGTDETDATPNSTYTSNLNSFKVSATLN